MERASTIMTLSQLRNRRKRRVKVTMAIILLVLIAVGSVFLYKYLNRKAEVIRGNEGTDYGLVVSILDVGQGNAAVISSGGEAMIIDSGLYEARGVVKDYLDAHNIQTIKYAVATHPHADHIGGMAEIIANYKVENLLLPDVGSENVCYEKMLEKAKETGTNLIHPKHMSTVSVGEAECAILSLNKDYGEELNDWSLVVKVSLDGKSFIFMSDASEQVEKDILASRAHASATVLVVGHHGSSDASTEEFLKRVNPTEAVISCGKDNEYGHPHKVVLDRLRKENIVVLRTDESGTINYGVKVGENLHRF